MAHPRFPYPMYEPLHRYDREWMVPGPRPDPAARHGDAAARPTTASSRPTWSGSTTRWAASCSGASTRPTSAAPTSTRSGPASASSSPTCTSCRGAPASCGSHVDQALDGRLVFLVRGDLSAATPGVVAHAVRRRPTAARDRPASRSSTARDSPVKTLFHVHLPPNVLLVGFEHRRRDDRAARARRGGSRCRRTRPSRASASTRRATAALDARQPDLGRLRRRRTGRVPRRDPAQRRVDVRRDPSEHARGARPARRSPTCSSSCPPGRRSSARRWWRERCA